MSSVVFSMMVHGTIFLCALICYVGSRYSYARSILRSFVLIHRCRSWPRPSCAFKMLSVNWYVRNRIKHVHPVSDGNSRCRLGAARHSTTSRVLPAQSASRVTVRHGMNVPDSLFPMHFLEWKLDEFRLKLHWSLFLRVQSTISQHWLR